MKYSITGTGLLLLLLLPILAGPVADCPGEVAQVPQDMGAWGYYHHDIFERICAVSIHTPVGERVYFYGMPGDADFALTWLGTRMVWIDNLSGGPVTGVSYWIGDSGWAIKLWLPVVQH